MTDWTQTTNTIDYGIKQVSENGNTTKVTLERIGRMPMPLDVVVTYKDGSQELFYVPQTLLRWSKPNESGIKRTDLEGWDWAYPTYDFTINSQKSNIKSIAIDNSGLLADVNRENNIYFKK